MRKDAPWTRDVHHEIMRFSCDCLLILSVEISLKEEITDDSYLSSSEANCRGVINIAAEANIQAKVGREDDTAKGDAENYFWIGDTF